MAEGCRCAPCCFGIFVVALSPFLASSVTRLLSVCWCPRACSPLVVTARPLHLFPYIHTCLFLSPLLVPCASWVGGSNRDLVIPRLKRVAGETRLLVMLRDPVKRAYSHYQMAIDPEGTPAQLRSRGGRRPGVAWLNYSVGYYIFFLCWDSRGEQCAPPPSPPSSAVRLSEFFLFARQFQAFRIVMVHVSVRSLRLISCPVSGEARMRVRERSRTETQRSGSPDALCGRRRRAHEKQRAKRTQGRNVRFASMACTVLPSLSPLFFKSLVVLLGC